MKLLDESITYYKLLDELAEKGLDVFKKELDTNPLYKGLLWTIIDETNDITRIDIETWDEKNLESEFLTTYEFDNEGKIIK